jgi:hypothetical protein
MNCTDYPVDDYPVNNYPTWVCSFCAKIAGGKIPRGHVYTIHIGICDICGRRTKVTEPRDFGYPVFHH